MIHRPITETDVDRVLPLLAAGGVGAWSDAEAFQNRLATGEYRPEWTWIAEKDGEVHAVGVWWGPPDQSKPAVLDTLHARTDDPATLAADLLTAAHRSYGAALEYHVMLPADWHSQPDAVAALEWRREAAARAGLTEPVERLRYEWTRAAGVPTPSSRLRFRPDPDDEVFVDLFRRALAQTLDAATSQEAAAVGAEEAARSDVAFYRDSMLGDRAWWRVAETSSGEPVGFGLPSRNTGFHVVGYLGVLPEQRGHGHVDDILAEITRFLAEEAGADVIRADTDLTNQPMAKSFDRLGYTNFARRLVLSPPR
ncbi:MULTISPECIES: GNAT family N-acetyltransferase [unclassified Saccharothrix]|uniref:GNAT family N-acetyltransferase n=1 Tax=unclassified Saccharothrix TaxID=2593673 RepID=UPI00307CCF8A